MTACPSPINILVNFPSINPILPTDCCRKSKHENNNKKAKGDKSMESELEP